MNEFLRTHRLALTPLSPIHIGCGEDFEPTNYVIEGGVLYGFDPSRAVLNDVQKGKLNEAVQKVSLLAIQRFFRDHAAAFKSQANVLVPVASGVGEEYERRVGREANVEANGNQVFNRLFIERHTRVGSHGHPYIPGSSFKGALRTSIVDALNDGQPPRADERRGRDYHSHAVEKRLLQGDFQTSPLRLLKVADLMPREEPARRVMYAVNQKKAPVMKDGVLIPAKGIAARKECIAHGQYRAFVADAVNPSLEPHRDTKNTPTPALRAKVDLRAVALQSNAYHLTRLQREVAVLDGRGFLHPEWKAGIAALLAGALGRKLLAGDAFLVRLGRYGGAESKTLSGEGVAQIKIMQGKGQAPVLQSTTKTVWLAAEHADASKHLLPFGWAVVEIDPDEDCDDLKVWCDQQSQGRLDMTVLRESFAAERAADAQRKTQQAADQAAREAWRLAEQRAAEERAQALATMTEQARDVETLRQNCEEWAKRIALGNYKKQTTDVGKACLFQDAHKLVSRALASTDWSAQDRHALADMLEQWVPQVAGPWGKDERKKLRLAALRAQA